GLDPNFPERLKTSKRKTESGGRINGRIRAHPKFHRRREAHCLQKWLAIENRGKRSRRRRRSKAPAASEREAPPLLLPLQKTKEEAEKGAERRRRRSQRTESLVATALIKWEGRSLVS
ncbi:hypothetical protein LINGRAHAP2_LOCUS21706, partial [Linum grandiflorum]